MHVSLCFYSFPLKVKQADSDILEKHKEENSHQLCHHSEKTRMNLSLPHKTNFALSTADNISVLVPGSMEALSVQLGWVGLGFRLSWFKSDHLHMCFLMVLRLAPTRRNFFPMEDHKNSRGWAGKPDASGGLQFLGELPLTLHGPKQVIHELTWLGHHAHPPALHVTQQVSMEIYSYHTGVFPSRPFYVYCTWLNNCIKIILHISHSSPFPCFLNFLFFFIPTCLSHLPLPSLALKFPFLASLPPVYFILLCLDPLVNGGKKTEKNEGTALFLI